MKNIRLKDLKLIRKKRKPKFLWMKEEDIYRIEYKENCIYWYNKQWLEVYFENSSWYWCKIEYNKQGKEIYYETSTWDWRRREYNKQGNEVYFENSSWYWCERGYNEQREQICFEDYKWFFRKKEDWKLIEYIDGKYFIDWQEAVLITPNL